MALALTTFASCQQDDELINVQNKVSKTFYATMENGAGTRTALDENNNVLWSEGDQISVFAGTTYNRNYILKTGAGTTSGTFDTNDLSFSNSPISIAANAAYYPYDSNVTVSESEGTFTFNATFPATQTFSASGTFGNGASPMVAVSKDIDDNDFSFKNVGAIFRLQLKGTATITKVIFSANASLAGKCEITASNDATPTVSITEGSQIVTLNCGNGVQLKSDEATNFIVAMLPVAIEEGGMTIAIYDNAGKKMVYTHKADQAITIERSKAYTTTEVTYSGNQDALTAIGAQAALDNATSGTTIQLEPGVNYGTLVFRQNANSTVVDITDIGGDAAGNEHYSKYENITIIGAPGAIVDQIDFQVGWIDNSRGASYVDIDNLIVKDVTFSGEKTAFNMESSKGSALGIDGLRIENCTMNDAEGNDRLVFQQISGYKALTDKSTSESVMTAGVKNLTITGCEVTGAYMVIESRAMENLSITNNTFTGIKARDMLITSDVTNHADKTYTGTITITGNTSIGGEERFIRASLNNSDAVVNISNNTISDYKGADADYIKVTDGINGNANVTIENNTCSYMVETVEGLNKAIKGGATTIVLAAGEYEIPTGASGKTLKFIGRGNPGDVKIAINNINYNLSSSTVTFENISINSSSGSENGYVSCMATYKNCIINGFIRLYGDSNFENCTFNVTGDNYNIWTWGASVATFTGCTFNSDGKALYLYGGGTTTLTVNNCVFNDNDGLVDELKAAIEIGNDYGTSYELIVNNTIVNGYAVNTKGINTGTTLWGNKHSMGKDKLNVVVDGEDVY